MGGTSLAGSPEVGVAIGQEIIALMGVLEGKRVLPAMLGIGCGRLAD
ncbi:MAG: hypothetical protein VX502_01600 [Candidatus Thermoplasmatota archaeon]|nr:hypothetical protein [Candidatus Thermoplasmatota archaeon]MEE2625444.1 hypothetical protein [Candidatus Thermoplasmatota archaeon]